MSNLGPVVRLNADLSNVQEFYESRLPEGWNGRLGGSDNNLFVTMPAPPPRATVAQAKSWREKVRANIVRREEMFKSIPAMLKERARVKVYDYIFGWILEDLDRGQTRLGKYSSDVRGDVNLHL